MGRTSRNGSVTSQNGTLSPGNELRAADEDVVSAGSGMAGRRLREEANLKNVFVLAGGWEAWQESAK